MTIKKGNWQVLGSKIVHRNPYYQVRRDDVIKPDGTTGTYHVVECQGAVFIVAIADDNQIYVEELYRYTSDKLSLEIPAGSTDGEAPLIAAKRELQEETGLTADSWQQLPTLNPANGLLQEDNYVFIATHLHDTGQHKQQEEGITKVIKLPFKTLLQKIARGDITDSQTIAALTLAGLELGWLKVSSND